MAQAQEKEANFAFEISDVIVQASETYRGSINVQAGDDEIESKIPITVHNGAYSGPTLTLIAGIYGSEYAPILAMQDLAAQIYPIHLTGTVIIVHIANLPAFAGMTIYFGPNDLKNLTRSFPGCLNGTVTERIAFILTQKIIKRSDFVIDINAGDGNESLRPSYSAYFMWQTSAIIHGGERNYISATVTLFVMIYNLFLSLLQLFGIMGDD